MTAADTRNDAMFSTLMSRWNTAPELQGLVPDDRATHMHEARHTLQATMGVYLPWMQPPDAALYIDLLRAPDADALSGQFFRCFDLMVRTRGTAIAVLRMHELYRLLQPHVAR